MEQKVNNKTYQEWENYINNNRDKFPITKLDKSNVNEYGDIDNDLSVEFALDLGDKLNFFDNTGEWKSNQHRNIAYELVHFAPMYEI